MNSAMGTHYPSFKTQIIIKKKKYTKTVKLKIGSKSDSVFGPSAEWIDVQHIVAW
jgi:hypothetical protein